MFISENAVFCTALNPQSADWRFLLNFLVAEMLNIEMLVDDRRRSLYFRMLSFLNLFATTPVAATGFQTTAAYYTLRGDGLLGSQTYAAL